MSYFFKGILLSCYLSPWRWFTIYRTYQQIPKCHPTERAYGSEYTFLYWLSLIALKVQSLTLSEWQIEIVLELRRSQHMQAVKHLFFPPTLTQMLCVYGKNCGSFIVNGWPAWTMATLSPFLIHHKEHLCCGGPGEQRFSQVEWFQFSLGNDSCSVMEQCTQVTKTQWNNEKWWHLRWASASLVLLEKY